MSDFSAGEKPTATQFNEHTAPVIDSGRVIVDMTPGTSYTTVYGSTAYLGTASVVFNKTFTTPCIVATAHSSIPGADGNSIMEVSINNPTSAGFDIVISREGQIDTNVHWIAIEDVL